VTSSPIEIVRRQSVRVADYPAGATFGPRELFDEEFIWLLRGSAVWTVQAGWGKPAQQIVLRPGMLALCKLGTVDHLHWDPDTISTHGYAHFTISHAERLGPRETWPRVRDMSAAPVLGGLTTYLLELAKLSGEQAAQRTDELLALLLDVFVTGPFGASPLEGMPDALIKIIDATRSIWIAEGMRIVSVEELATQVNVSPGHVFRLFRETYGIGPARALELVRLVRAATWLQRSNSTLAEIAERAGFANAYHFSRRFSGAYGSAPGAFRRRGTTSDPYEVLRSPALVSLAQVLLQGPAQPARLPRDGQLVG
jgi:AraC family transcriptional regulator